MRKKAKKILMLIFAVLVVITLAQTETVRAATLNVKSKTMYVGESFTLKVSGTTKNVKFSSTKKSVASVNKKGKVTAKKAGNATIKAKVGKKTLKCAITVKDKFSSTAATKNVEVELLDTGRGVIAVLKNDSKWNLNIEATLVYMKDGNILETDKESIYVFEKGTECALFFYAPTDENYKKVVYDDYKISLSMSEASYNAISKVKKVKTSGSLGTKGLVVETENASGTELNTVIVAAVFYDANGNVIGYEYTYADCKSNGSVDFIELQYPYDENYNTIIPVDYKIYVNAAYSYDWEL